MASKVTPMLVVVATALTLAVGALGVTGGFEPNLAAAAVDGGDVTNTTKR